MKQLAPSLKYIAEIIEKGNNTENLGLTLRYIQKFVKNNAIQQQVLDTIAGKQMS